MDERTVSEVMIEHHHARDRRVPPASMSRPPFVALRLVASMAVFGAILFVTAGTLAWPAAWGYLAVITVVLGVYSFVVLPMHPDLAAERNHPPADAKRWDRPFAVMISIAGPAALVLLSGFDRRFHWSPPVPAWLQVAGLAVGLAGGMMTNYAVAANRFFSGLVRIQRDRGHHVIDTGPYRFVRHPGYTGAIANMIGMAVALGSRPALLTIIAVSLVLVVRTALEDRTLQAELDGYAAYARRVRYRLVPGVW
jgi:protein-S-isoprenylcysteine O-methyltransferase Ste14